MVAHDATTAHAVVVARAACLAGGALDFAYALIADEPAEAGFTREKAVAFTWRRSGVTAGA